jgi:pyruvate/2-oxoglutarate dehydrogenase complex dihydrolipoamide acyltransferase (E2) component
MPKLAMGMSEGTISAWLVQDGAEVAAGQPLYTVEFEKSNQEVESPADGRLKIVAAAGLVYAVGTLLAQIE